MRRRPDPGAASDSPITRGLRRVVITIMGSALVAFLSLAIVAGPPSSASGAAWYAYVLGGATAPTSCPQTGTAADQCTVAQALSLAAAGDTVYLATPGATGPMSATGR